jgi:beta-alanine--pyruvate transaminase
MRVFEKAVDEGLLVRFSGDTIAVAPPFICSENDIRTMVEGLRRALHAVRISSGVSV